MSTSSQAAEQPVRFTNQVARFASIAMGSFFALIGLAQLADSRPVGSGARIFGACVVVIGIWFACRGYLSATVIVAHGRVVTRSFFRTHRYGTADLASAGMQLGRTGMNGHGREYLVLHLKDGSTVSFKELSSPPAKPGEPPTVVQRASEAIQATIQG